MKVNRKLKLNTLQNTFNQIFQLCSGLYEVTMEDELDITQQLYFSHVT